MVIKFHLYIYNINMNIKQARPYHSCIPHQYIHCQLPMQGSHIPIGVPNNNNTCILSLSSISVNTSS